ncbi:hypothetical protein [Kingella potus]|uniref:hypothetical protein n=1 Tax=Kingella potus TaxID=265175 RepID=UPI001FD624A9|nr:hypothetical protein [Kingella potus]UOP01812.1 hypothetical protein LVJ84_06895 [Kingella potus]
MRRLGGTPYFIIRFSAYFVSRYLRVGQCRDNHLAWCSSRIAGRRFAAWRCKQA